MWCVQDEYTSYRTTHGDKDRGVLRRARSALRSIAVVGAAAAVGVRVGATQHALAGK